MSDHLNRAKSLLWIFSGEDKYIIKNCSAEIQKRFTRIGILVITIILGCWISSYVFLSYVFELGFIFKIPLSFFCALVLGNLYVLLLYTISPILIPRKNSNFDGQDSTKYPFVGAMVVRVIFITLLAIVIAQPLSLLILFGTTDDAIDQYKIEYKINALSGSRNAFIEQEIQSQKDFLAVIQKSENHFFKVSPQIALVNSKIEKNIQFLTIEKGFLMSLKDVNGSKSDPSKREKYLSNLNSLDELIQKEASNNRDFDLAIKNLMFVDNSSASGKYLQDIRDINQKKIKNFESVDALLNQSNFFVKRLQILFGSNPIFWLIIITVWFLFFFPIYEKYNIRNQKRFYILKREIENRIIMDEYTLFKKQYTRVLEANILKYNQNILHGATPFLSKIHELDVEKYNSLHKDLFENTAIVQIEKYEFWADPPFRTKRKKEDTYIRLESDLLAILYPAKK